MENFLNTEVYLYKSLQNNPSKTEHNFILKTDLLEDYHCVKPSQCGVWYRL